MKHRITINVLIALVVGLSVTLCRVAKAVVVVSELDSTTIGKVVVPTTTSSEGATISNISAAQYADIINTGDVSWVARFQAGGSSGSESYEMSVSANGTSSETKDHAWVYPQTVGVYYGYGGNQISAYAGTTNLSGTPTLSFNTILMRVMDFATLQGSVSFNGGTFVMDGQLTNISNVSVNETSKYFLFELSKTNPQFKIEGMFDATKSNFDRGRIEFTGLYLIPEPSSLVYLFLSIIAFGYRRR